MGRRYHGLMKRASTIIIFRYLDYREFLRDWYAYAKKSRASVSFRSFSKKAGFQSTNFFKLVMEGKRNLTEESLNKFAEGLDLNKQEKEFFRNLVYFNQVKTHEEKNFYYQQLLRSRKYSELKPLEREQFEYYSNWYHPVLRELIASPDFDGTPEWLAGRVLPLITAEQAAKSLELLERLGFIRKTGPSKWVQSDLLISTGPEAASLMVTEYHKNLLQITRHALETIAPEKRDVSTMTLGVAKERLTEIKKKIQEFRQDILKLVSSDRHPETVVQLNIQMFPVTTDKKEPKS